MLDELFGLWSSHLWDNIPSVRANSALALANCVRAYGDEVMQRLLPVIRWGGAGGGGHQEEGHGWCLVNSGGGSWARARQTLTQCYSDPGARS